MKVKLTGYGIANDILQTRNMIFEFQGSTIEQLKLALIEQYPAFTDLRSISFAVHEEYQTDDFSLQEQDQVVIIPPVSGG